MDKNNNNNNVEELPEENETPKFTQSQSHQPVATTEPPSSPTTLRKAHSIHNVMNSESLEEEMSGDVFSSRPNSKFMKRAASGNSSDFEENDTSPIQPLGSIDINKLKKSMRIRSAYLSYNDVDDDDDDDDAERRSEVRSRTNSFPKQPTVEEEGSVESFDSHSDMGGSDDKGARTMSMRDRDNTILTYEIFSSGDKKYCDRTMRNLYLYMLKSCQDHDVDLTATKSNRHNLGIAAPTQGASSGIGFLQLRDLRRLEYLFTPQEEPAIFVRRHAVIISLDPLRVVVMADRLILFVPDGADVLIQLLSNQMQSYMNDVGTELPFEMQAYEAIFGTVIEIQKLQLSDLDARIKKVSKILRKYSIVPVEIQEKVQQFKQRVSEMIERAKAHKHILEELLEADDELALLALSLLKEKPQLYSIPLSQEILRKHEEGESMLESYLMDYNSIQSKLNLLKSQLHGAEVLVSLRLDTSRNELLITNTVVSVVSCTFAVGGYIGALFGMNLRNGFEGDTNSGTFWTVTAVTTFLVVVSTIGTIIYLKYAEILPSRFNYLSQNEIKQL